MPKSERPASLLSKLYENKSTLEASILELSKWIEHRGSAQVAENVHSALDTLDENDKAHSGCPYDTRMTEAQI